MQCRHGSQGFASPANIQQQDIAMPSWSRFQRLQRVLRSSIAATSGAAGVVFTTSSLRDSCHKSLRCDEGKKQRLNSFWEAPMPLRTEVVDRKGYCLDVHDACVLEDTPRFKGAIWAPVAPTGVVMWHNSGFSNWYPFANDASAPAPHGGSFTVMHMGEKFNFGNSESLIMAIKERIATGCLLSDILSKHVALDAQASKESAARSGRAYPLWGDHTLQVLIGAVACLLKFSQDPQLRSALLETADCVLIETAPNDGAWGVGKNSSLTYLSFLCMAEQPEHYTLQSTEASEFDFTAGVWSGSRRRCEANALGKALMLVRNILKKDVGFDLDEPTFASALAAICDELQHTPGVRLVGINERVADLANLLECEKR